MSLFSSAVARGTLASRPTDYTSLTVGRLYFATDTGQWFRDNGAGWDDVTSSFMALLDLIAGSAPATPSAGRGRLYEKSSDKRLYFKDDAGVEYLLGAPSGAANQVLATATSGGAALAALRALVAADIPNLDTAKLTTGQLADARLALMNTTQAANKFLSGPASGAAANPAWRIMALADLPTLFDTADVGYFFAPTYVLPAANVAAVINGSANLVRCIQMILPQPAVIGQITMEVTTLAAASTGDVGIYSADGNTLLAHTGGISLAATGIIRTALTGAPITLPAGTYMFAWTSSSATAQARLLNLTASGFQNFLNVGSTKKCGTAANAATAGILPATLGAISASSISPLVALFER